MEDPNSYVKTVTRGGVTRVHPERLMRELWSEYGVDVAEIEIRGAGAIKIGDLLMRYNHALRRVSISHTRVSPNHHILPDSGQTAWWRTLTEMSIVNCPGFFGADLVSMIARGTMALNRLVVRNSSTGMCDILPVLRASAQTLVDVALEGISGPLTRIGNFDAHPAPQLRYFEMVACKESAAGAAHLLDWLSLSHALITFNFRDMRIYEESTDENWGRTLHNVVTRTTVSSIDCSGTPLGDKAAWWLLTGVYDACQDAHRPTVPFTINLGFCALTHKILSTLRIALETNMIQSLTVNKNALADKRATGSQSRNRPVVDEEWNQHQILGAIRQSARLAFFSIRGCHTPPAVTTAIVVSAMGNPAMRVVDVSGNKILSSDALELIRIRPSSVMLRFIDDITLGRMPLEIAQRFLDAGHREVHYSP